MNTNNNMKVLYKLLKEFEGERSDVYIDSLNYFTVGIGHRLTGREKPKIPFKRGFLISDEQLQDLFIDDIKNAIHVANDIFPNYEKHPNQIKVFMVLMSYNLGYRLRGFKRANKALIDFNYGKARLEYINSKWAKQVHLNRTTKTTDLLRFKHE